MTPRFDVPLSVSSGDRVLLLGVGGGFDVLCTLPIAVALRAQGCQIHLASYSTTDFSRVQAPAPAQRNLMRIDQSMHLSTGGHFSEDMVARWASSFFGVETPVWCFTRPGVQSMSAGLAWLVQSLAIDAIVLVDGGVDGLFIGDEHDTATPSMDAVSIIAAWSLKHPRTLYSFTAFGTEGVGYEVRHADALRRIAELVGRGAMLGVSALLRGGPPGDEFRAALGAIGGEIDPLRRSIINASILAAMDGRFGETHLTPRTDHAPVWVSPLTLLYWFFDLNAVAETKPYLHEVLATDDVADVAAAIARFRTAGGVRRREDIPI